VTVLDVVVVGGGQAGLAMGYHLRERGVRFEILDASPTVGHVWRERWNSLRLFTPAQYASLPGMALPADRDTYPTKDQVADYLRDYAAHFQLPIRHNEHVTVLRRDDAGFALDTATEHLLARQVVVATGPFQTPVIPDCAIGMADEVTQLHSSSYRGPEQLPSGRVLVVGAGNSGFQIAEELAHHGVDHVQLAIGTRNVCVPQRPLGRDIFWWQHVTGLITAPADSRRGRWMRQGEGTVIGVSTRDLRHAGVELRPRLTDIEGRLARFGDGTSAEIDAVVWATGFRQDHSWITVDDALDSCGVLRHQRGVTPVAGLYVLGLPWQHTTGSALLGFVGRDAAYLDDHIGRRIPASQRDPDAH
jgi:putative flavoprotein involved in K+ transport